MLIVRHKRTSGFGGSWAPAVLALLLTSCSEEVDRSQLGQAQTPLPDQPVSGRGSAGQLEIEKAIEPYVKIARSTYPEAKARFQTGLPEGSAFLVTTRIRDDSGGLEQAYVLVKEIEGGRVVGIIASELTTVSGFRIGQPYELSESEVLDWTIANPDGTQEGNVVGRFLAEWQKQQR